LIEVKFRACCGPPAPPTRQRASYAPALADTPNSHGRVVHSCVPTDLEDEETWLRHRIVRMRTVLRFARDPRAEAGMRELIADAEARLAALEAKK
jgi:hypothetical protein